VTKLEWAAVLALAALAACSETAPEPVRPVRTVTVKIEPIGEIRSATGDIQARYEADLGFRVAGKILERPVDVGSRIVKGDVIARLDDLQATSELTAAEAEVAAAEAQLAEAQKDADRQRELMKSGFATSARLDQAESKLETAEANVRSAQAQLAASRDQLSFTVLNADIDGTVTEVGAEAGQVVQAGQMVVRVVDPREIEAVFHVPEAALRAMQQLPEVEVVLAGEPALKTMGHVREVAPSADPQTRTYEVRVSLPVAPPQMALGATVVGAVQQDAEPLIGLPSTALFHIDDAPAVWVVDPATSTVSLKPVEIARYENERVLIKGGLVDGDVVVTAGVNTLRDGQTVRLPSGASS